ncbi:MAG TPA: TIGR04157 family glycosyltransferase [Bacteroidales bacterium]|nr:TIGR04157 family glycosyltransferase [Bacteroidales bacterium]
MKNLKDQNLLFKQRVDERLRRIANVLLLNASFIDNLGLLNGKMGIAIFFYNYSRYTKNKIFEDYAGELIEQVFKKVHDYLPGDFSSGLAGIGWGVGYLIQNGFAEALDDSILEELDTVIFQLDRKNPKLPRVYNDFYTYGLYYLCRAKSDVWNEEALQLIWNDFTVLLNETLPDEVKLCPGYIITLLYFIQEIQKRSYCPSGIDELIAAIPGFVTKHMDGKLNSIECQYLDILFQNLGINSSHRLQTFNDQSTAEEQLELYGQAAIYELVFPNLRYTTDSVSNYKTGILEFLEYEEVWENIFKIVNNNNSGLPSGLTGYALSLLKKDCTHSNIPITQPTSHETIYIFNRKSRAAEYGIGTYIKELTTCLKNKAFNVTVVYFEADKVEFTIEEHDGIQNWYIPAILNQGTSILNYNEYMKSAITLLRLYIKETGKLIFHLNFMRDHQLSIYLHEFFICKILLVVHYMDWSDTLQGDLSWMRRLLSQPEETITDHFEKRALRLFKEDRELLEKVDHIVCLADYAHEILCLDYGIKAEKITVVNNGLTDKAKTLSIEERSGLKEKYKINPDEKIILCAGRLDEIKGISYLIKAFKSVLELEPDCRLWIIGDGAYNPLLKEAESIWNKLCFTGRIDQEHLFELYSIADIGVIPSLFEPFGYVAVEMMMHGLPVVVTGTTGLDEIVEDGVSGLKVQVAVSDNRNEVDTGMMAQKILFMLQNPGERERLGSFGRKRYMENYTSTIMCQKMRNCYLKLLQSLPDKQLYTVY